MQSVLSAIRGGKKRRSSPKQHASASADNNIPRPGIPFKTAYTSRDVPIPASFLTTQPPDASPITINKIDFSTSPLPEYSGCYAVILDNVLSPSECRTLLSLAEASVPATQNEGKPSDPWQPALVNVGSGYEVLQPDYRNSDRIIWDQQVIVDRLWERIKGAGCPGAEDLRARLEVVDGDVEILGRSRHDKKTKWEFIRVNDRMRFLKYVPGGFFKPHCDAPYRESGDKPVKTIFTLHLYLNDSKQVVGEGADLEGGATSFLSDDEERRLDVDPKAGRVLIFQHLKLLHSGDDVKGGVKYTMRTDLLYEMVERE